MDISNIEDLVITINGYNNNTNFLFNSNNSRIMDHNNVIKIRESDIVEDNSFNLYIQLIGSTSNVIQYVQIIFNKKDIVNTYQSITYDPNKNISNFPLETAIISISDTKLFKETIHTASGKNLYKFMFGNQELNNLEEYIFTKTRSGFGDLYTVIKYTKPYEYINCSSNFNTLVIIKNQDYFNSKIFPEAMTSLIYDESIIQLDYNIPASNGSLRFYENEFLYYGIQDLYNRGYEYGIYRLNTSTNENIKLLEIHSNVVLKYGENQIIYSELYDFEKFEYNGIEDDAYIQFYSKVWISDKNNINNKTLLFDSDINGIKLGRIGGMIIKDDILYLFSNNGIFSDSRKEEYYAALISYNLKNNENKILWKTKTINETNFFMGYFYNNYLYVGTFIRGMQIIKFNTNNSENYVIEKIITIGENNDFSGDLQSWGFSEELYNINNKDYLVLCAKMGIIFIDLDEDIAYISNSLANPLINMVPIGFPNIVNKELRFSAMNSQNFFEVKKIGKLYNTYIWNNVELKPNISLENTNKVISSIAQNGFSINPELLEELETIKSLEEWEADGLIKKSYTTIFDSSNTILA